MRSPDRVMTMSPKSPVRLCCTFRFALPAPVCTNPASAVENASLQADAISVAEMPSAAAFAASKVISSSKGVAPRRDTRPTPSTVESCPSTRDSTKRRISSEGRELFTMKLTAGRPVSVPAVLSEMTG